MKLSIGRLSLGPFRLLNKSIDIGSLKYVVALYEGEGSCYRSFQNGRKKPTHRLQIKMTDKEPLENVTLVMGFGSLSGPHSNGYGNKSIYCYHCSNFESVQAFLAAIFPLLSPRRQEQACICLDREYTYEYDYE